jgi:hypothetical protein
VTGEETTIAVIDALNTMGVSYMIVGSFASNFYGVPRATQDADFVLLMRPGLIEELIGRLGPQFRFDPQLSFETVTGTHRYVICTSTGDFYVELFRLADDEYDQERFRRRCRVQLWDHETCIPTPEDVIVTKLLWAHRAGRTKDVNDARGVVLVHSDRLDWDYIERWCDRQGTRPLLEDLRR